MRRCHLAVHVLVAIAIIPAVAIAAEAPPPQPLPPIALRSMSASICQLSPKSYSAIDHGLAVSRQVQDSEYGWLHYYTYCAAVHAAAVGDKDRSCQLLDEYLFRTAEVSASALVPEDILACDSFCSARRAVVRYRERMAKQWGNHRWALHNYKSDQVGFEYESALSLRILQTDGSDIVAVLTPPVTSRQSGAGENCRIATADTRRLLCALRLQQTGFEQRASGLLKQLATSDSFFPVHPDLLATITDPPRMILGVRLRAALVLFSIAVAAVVLVRSLRKRHRKACSSHPESDLCTRYEIDRRDILSCLAVRWLGLSPAYVFLLGFIFIGGGMAVLAWSEDVLWPSGPIVDRAFLDYLSFPYGFGLLIPAFLAGTLLNYRLVNAKLPGVLRLCFPEGEGSRDIRGEVDLLWQRYADICNSRWLTIGCLGASLAITVFHKVQWAGDPGTAFVDLRYPGHWSLTGMYYTLWAPFVCYCVLSCIVRAAAVLRFVCIVYSQKWRRDNGVTVKFDAGHPDKCSGVQPLGWILLLFYVLLLLLATQVLLNMVEKLRFYESFDIVMHHTFVSVVGFGAAFLLSVPLLVGRPLMAIHLAMREYRRAEGLRLSALTDRHTAVMLRTVANESVGIAEVEALSAMKMLESEMGSMPLWPFDLKVGVYFVASHIVPALSFLLPVIQDRLSLYFPG